MLAYYVRWHLERKWSPLLFRDERPPVPEDPVAPARRSESALEKAHTGRQPDGSLVYSFRGLLAELATLTKNTVRLLGSEVAFEKLALPTPSHTEALHLLRDFVEHCDAARPTKVWGSARLDSVHQIAARRPHRYRAVIA